MCASGVFFNVLNGGLWGWFMGYIADYASDLDIRFRDLLSALCWQ